MATIRDVAQIAGVSVGTVSRYLNGYTLKKENDTKVSKAIKQLNFKQNYIAKGLKNKKSHTIGVIVNNLTDVFAASVVTPLEYYLEENGYSLILCDYANKMTNLEKKITFLDSRSVDGIVVFHLDHSIPALDALKEENIPLVAVDAPISGINCDAVLVDNYNASFNVVQKFYQLGHRKIGIIAGTKNRYISIERLRGYIDAMRENNIYEESLIEEGNYFKKDGYFCTKKLLKNNPDITALYITNYYMTIGAIQAIHEKGLIIPDDISIIGFDDYDLSDVIQPKLSVVAQPVHEIGKKIGKILLEKIKNPKNKKYKKYYLKTKLVWRDSVGKITYSW